MHQLESPTPQQRSEALDNLTELLQQNEWQLPSGQGAAIFSALRDRLNDANWYGNLHHNRRTDSLARSLSR